MSDLRPCKGTNSNVCVGEGCYGESCIKDRLTYHDVQIVPFAPIENPVTIEKLVGKTGQKTGQHRKTGHDSNGPQTVIALVMAHTLTSLFYVAVGGSLCFLALLLSVVAGINDVGVIYTDLMWQVPLLSGLLWANLEFYTKERDTHGKRA